MGSRLGHLAMAADPRRSSVAFWNFMCDKPAGADLMSADKWGRVSSKTCTIGCTGLTTTASGSSIVTRAAEPASWDNLVPEESFGT